MKRVFPLAFIVFFILPSVGLQILVHTCGGETTVELMPTSAEDPCDCGNQPLDGCCCTIELRTFHLGDMHQPVEAQLPTVGASMVAGLAPSPCEAAAGRCGPCPAAAPFPPPSVPPTILYCTFLI